MENNRNVSFQFLIDLLLQTKKYTFSVCLFIWVVACFPFIDSLGFPSNLKFFLSDLPKKPLLEGFWNSDFPREETRNTFFANKRQQKRMKISLKNNQLLLSSASLELPRISVN